MSDHTPSVAHITIIDTPPAAAAEVLPALGLLADAPGAPAPVPEPEEQLAKGHSPPPTVRDEYTLGTVYST